MKKVASFRDAYNAHFLRGSLEAEGIPAFVLDEQVATINWLYSEAIGGVKVHVPDEFYDKALDIIEKINRPNESEETKLEAQIVQADVCPSCGSSSIATTKYSLWTLLPALIFLCPLFFGKRRWQCESCGFKWK